MDDIKEFLKGQSNKVLVILLILTLPALGWLLWDKINSKPVNSSVSITSGEVGMLINKKEKYTQYQYRVIKGTIDDSVVL